jgi:hypothetical protein
MIGVLMLLLGSARQAPELSGSRNGALIRIRKVE